MKSLLEHEYVGTHVVVDVEEDVELVVVIDVVGDIGDVVL